MRPISKQENTNSIIDSIIKSNQFTPEEIADFEQHFGKMRFILAEINDVDLNENVISLTKSSQNPHIRYSNWQKVLSSKTNPNILKDNKEEIKNQIYNIHHNLDKVNFAEHPTFRNTVDSALRLGKEELTKMMNESRENIALKFNEIPNIGTVMELFVQKFTIQDVQFLDHVLYLCNVSHTFVAYSTEHHLMLACGIKMSIAIMHSLYKTNAMLNLYSLSKQHAFGKNPQYSLSSNNSFHFTPPKIDKIPNKGFSYYFWKSQPINRFVLGGFFKTLYQDSVKNLIKFVYNTNKFAYSSYNAIINNLPKNYSKIIERFTQVLKEYASELFKNFPPKNN